jgi:hypothetical protein
MGIENGITIPNASYPILRIFASWPADAKLNRTQDLKKPKGRKATKFRANVDEDSVSVTDPDLHPLATLHLENFDENSRRFAQSWNKNDAELAIAVFVKDQRDDKGKAPG